MQLPEICLEIASDMDAACAVMQARKLAEQLGFDDVGRCKVATVVSELAQNILKYADHGRMVLRGLQNQERIGVEIVASDRGPGIANLSQAMQDHFSSGGTLGLGLPGVKRLMHEFQINSTVGQGTQVTVRRWL